MSHLFNDIATHDIKIITPHDEYHLHKVFLSKSRMLHAMVSDKYAEGQRNVIDFSDVPFLGVLKQVFFFFYSGKVTVSDNMLGKFWEALIYFQVEDDAVMIVQDLITDNLEKVSLAEFHDIASCIVVSGVENDFVKRVTDILLKRSVQDHFFEEFDYADEKLTLKAKEYRHLIQETNLVTRKQLLCQADALEKSESYDMLRDVMNECLILSHYIPSPEERNFYSIGCKFLIGDLRSRWRVLQSIIEEQKAEEGVLLEKHIKEIEDRLRAFIADTLSTVDLILLNCPESDIVARVFFYKMRGDYYRFTCEFERGEPFNYAQEKGLEAYTVGLQIGRDNLRPTNPNLLGLSLNFTVFYYEIMHDAQRACDLGREVFDTALAHLDELGENDYKDSTLILQLIRDNLTLWMTEE
eukprot:TRINITY_DN6122_c0_g1_i1.p1 TRINITY_DN6122_c0_g1~~TRINITY_DN6122_c0_g1_i1.p1  ORF type:complete len:418 (-),score=85.78 TRINITY_DN6122_c0_g1_i1:24-1253(-)